MRIIGLDLSISSTGVSVIEIDNNNLKVVDNFSIKPSKPGEFNKFHFYLTEKLMLKLGNIFEQYNWDFSISFEFPVFGNYTSELQFYITQELLRLCYNSGIDVVGYSPHFLKKFVKLFATGGEKYPSHLEKEHIRKIYEKYVLPLNEGVLPESKDVKDNDSMDALFLGVLGAILQASYLQCYDNSIFPPLTLKGILNHEFDYLLLTDNNYYRNNYLYEIWDVELNNFNFNSSGEGFGKQFKSLVVDSRNNNHLTLQSRMFFPFKLLSVLTSKMRVFRMYREEEFYEFWTKYLSSRNSFLRKNFPKWVEFECLFNKRGSYFLYNNTERK